jgi:hypothetical protein
MNIIVNKNATLLPREYIKECWADKWQLQAHMEELIHQNLFSGLSRTCLP